ncbi:uncharacterized protein LOC103703430 [Phoenix dactylifera]|uniref:Uncharacterized protein LOC103703430 n=1 Tax=Phoenix dactylifera TaxID=42345 RepID=A0A8B7BSN1_PHODC|nr:uncharacterized protein LOC103703430 [Phoenix dactylifera]
MKPHPPSSPPFSPSPPALRRLLPRAVSFVLLFSLGYTLGFLSSSSSSPPEPPQFHVQTQFQSQPDNEIPVTTSQPPSAAPPHDLLRFRTKCADPVPQPDILRTVLDRVYNGSSPYAGFPPPAIAPLLYPPARRLRGWGSTTPVFRELVETVRPLTIIELGTFLGASALHMAALSRNLSLSSLILCLDDFRGWPGFRQRFPRDVPPPLHADALLLPQFMQAVAAAGEADRVIPVPFSTSSALTALCDWGVYGDLIEVDAGHDFHSAWADINMAYAVLRPGGVLFGHDYYTSADDHGVRRAVTLFAKLNGLRLRPHGQHWVLSPKPLHL